MTRVLYVSNVEKQTELCLIQDLFTTVGDVESQHLGFIPESGSKKEFGIFEMSTVQQAADCMERFHGQTLNGRQLSIVCERPKPRPIQNPKSKKALHLRGR